MSDSEVMNCEEALRLLALFLDGELDTGEHTSVEQHLETCRSCYSRSEFERRLKAQLRQLAHDDVTPAFEQHIRQLLSQFTSVSVPPPPAGDV